MIKSAKHEFRVGQRVIVDKIRTDAGVIKEVCDGDDSVLVMFEGGSACWVLSSSCLAIPEPVSAKREFKPGEMVVLLIPCDDVPAGTVLKVFDRPCRGMVRAISGKGLTAQYVYVPSGMLERVNPDTIHAPPPSEPAAPRVYPAGTRFNPFGNLEWDSRKDVWEVTRATAIGGRVICREVFRVTERDVPFPRELRFGLTLAIEPDDEREARLARELYESTLERAEREMLSGDSSVVVGAYTPEAIPSLQFHQSAEREMVTIRSFLCDFGRSTNSNSAEYANVTAVSDEAGAGGGAYAAVMWGIDYSADTIAADMLATGGVSDGPELRAEAARMAKRKSEQATWLDHVEEDRRIAALTHVADRRGAAPKAAVKSVLPASATPSWPSFDSGPGWED
jgi:hypothetical protein